MMGFITHCWKSVRAELWRMACWVLGAWLLVASSAWAQNSVAELTELRAERREAALYLTAQLKLELAAAVEDALMKGFAVHFVAEAEVMRDRWYWYDRKIGTATRYYRLAFQPLTRRWRLNVSHEPISGAGLAGSISQNFETLPEALNVIRRQSGWTSRLGNTLRTVSDWTFLSCPVLSKSPQAAKPSGPWWWPSKYA
jgi:hypothetical protein